MHVTPYAGGWIEITAMLSEFVNFYVTPYAGVWIEINIRRTNTRTGSSLPTRECGLK